MSHNHIERSKHNASRHLCQKGPMISTHPYETNTSCVLPIHSDTRASPYLSPVQTGVKSRTPQMSLWYRRTGSAPRCIQPLNPPSPSHQFEVRRVGVEHDGRTLLRNEHQQGGQQGVVPNQQGLFESNGALGQALCAPRGLEGGRAEGFAAETRPACMQYIVLRSINKLVEEHRVELPTTSHPRCKKLNTAFIHVQKLF